MPQPAPRDRPALATVEVDNPHFSTDHPEALGNPRRIRAAVKPDAIHSLRLRGYLDDAQLQAARKLQVLFEALEGGLRSPDPGRLAAGGSWHNGIGDREIHAGRQLAELRGLLGWRQFELLRAVCSLGLSIAELDLGAIGSGKRARLVATELLRISLADAAAGMGLG